MKVITSSYFEKKISVLEMDVAPNTGNPKHYHTLFEETFEVLEGALFIGLDKQTMTLQPGQSVTVPIGSVHFFKNKTTANCRIRITLNPGNTDFEDAMCIYYGLKEDGLVNTAGVPKKLSDLALFVKLNNSNMTGLGSIGGMFLNWMAHRAIKKGRLEQLRNNYTI